MNTQNVWIKRSEREPTEAELPIVMGGYMCGSGKVWDIALYSCLPPKSHWSGYWRSIKADPPPRELTQREKDATLARNIAMVNECTVTECVLEGIYAERREVLRALQDAHGHDWGADEDWAKHAQKLRARLDEQGAK